MIPMALSSLGVERYGLWTAVTSLTAMALFSDFGLGNGLMTKLASTYVSGDAASARQYIAASVGFTAVSALVIALVVNVVALVADPVEWIDPTTTISAAEGDLILVLCLTAFAVNIPLSLIHRVQYAYQQVTYSNVWTAAASLASVAAFFIAMVVGLPPVAQIAAAVFAPPVVNFVNAVTYLTWRRPELNPAGCRPGRGHVVALVRLGGAFFALSIVTSVALNADPLIISRQLGLEATASYSIAFRLSSAVGLLVTLINLPLWPANGEALARGDTDWVKKVTRRMILLSGGLVLIASAALFLAGPWVFPLWLGESSGVVDQSVLGWLLVWTLLLACASPVFMVQNAAGLVAPQMLGWALFLCVSLPAKWVLIPAFGITAAPAVACLAYVLLVLPASLVGMRMALLKKGQATVAEPSAP